MAYLLEFAQSLLGSLEEGGILANGIDINVRIKYTNITQCGPAVPSSVLHLETWVDLQSLEGCQKSSIHATMCENEQKSIISCESDQNTVDSASLDSDSDSDSDFAQTIDHAVLAIASQFRAILGLPFPLRIIWRQMRRTRKSHCSPCSPRQQEYLLRSKGRGKAPRPCSYEKEFEPP